MIIKFPTGLYKNNLPSEPTDTNNITYYISSNEPEFESIQYSVLPESKISNKSSKIHSSKTRRASTGELIFTLNNTFKTFGSNKKLFNIGEFLEFTDEQTSVDAVIVENVEIQHNNNSIDWNSMGLSEDEINEINDASNTTKLELEKKLTSVNKEVSIIKASIGENQKQLNEVNRTINAVFIIKSSINESIYTKLISKRDAITSDIDNLNDSLKVKVEESNAIYAEFITICNIVK